MKEITGNIEFWRCAQSAVAEAKPVYISRVFNKILKDDVFNTSRYHQLIISAYLPDILFDQIGGTLAGCEGGELCQTPRLKYQSVVRSPLVRS